MKRLQPRLKSIQIILPQVRDYQRLGGGDANLKLDEFNAQQF